MIRLEGDFLSWMRSTCTLEEGQGLNRVAFGVFWFGSFG